LPDTQAASASTGSSAKRRQAEMYGCLRECIRD
jgi:hypothetical protein